MTAAGGCNSRPLRTLFLRGIVSVGYAIAHPRLNPVDILPTGLRPSDVHSDDGIIMVVDGMTCEACEAETQARHIARGKRSATPGCYHPPPSGIRIGCELHNIHRRRASWVAWWVISLVYSCYDLSAMFAKRVKKSKTGIVYEC